MKYAPKTNLLLYKRTVILTRRDNSWIKLIVVGLLILLFIFLATHHARASPITKIHLLDWSAAESKIYIDKDTSLWATGKTARVIDVQTGISFTAVRYRGSNHADFEPATQRDTDTLKSIYGRWSWNRRPVIVIIAGDAFAASMNGMPHGQCSVKDNGYKGHSCIHFLNSKTHGSRKVDKAHQAAVMEAYNTNLTKLNILIKKRAITHEIPI